MTPRHPCDLRIVVVCPVFNEEVTVREVVQEVLGTLAAAALLNSSVVVVDDGSTDRTPAIARQTPAALISIPHKGLSAAFQAGVEYALAVGADVIAVVDGDGQHPVDRLPELCRMVTSGVDLVIGSRYLDGSPTWKPKLERAQSRSCSALFAYTCKVPVTDVHSGFRAFSSSVAKNVKITSRRSYTREQFFRATRQGFAVSELPVQYAPRRDGRSRLFPHRHLAAAGMVRDLLMWQVQEGDSPARLLVTAVWGFGAIGCSLTLMALSRLTGAVLRRPR